MKKLFKTSFILLSLLSMMFVSCRKDYDTPPIPNIPVGDVYTIGDLLAMPSSTTFDTASVFGIVTADEQSGNLYKTIFIQDRATGKAIELLMNSSSAARIGDSIRVCLDKNMMVNNYHNLPQLVGADGKGFSPDGHLVIYPYNKPIVPDTVTIADIKSGNYLAGLVRLMDVEFVDQGSNFCNIGENTNRTLKDETGELIVRTSNYANFAYDPIPSGKGSLVAIASVYNSDWQLIIRSKNEMVFGGGGGTINPPAPAGETQSLPYAQSFTTEFGTYTTKDVSGSQSWAIDYSTAKMTGYEGGTNYANEDWLISSPVDLTGVTEAKMTMVYIARYFSDLNNDITIWASTDYTWDNEPSTATWTKVPSTLKEGSDWSTFITTEISLNDYVGQVVTFAVKYASTEQKAGTIEIQSITIQEGAGGGVTPVPGTVTGDGSRENPYTASDIITLGIETSDGNKYWVKDYIVGFVDANYNYQFTADGAVNTNLSLSKADASSSEECVPVQLPVGAIREGLNLADHPNNLGQEVLMYGTLEKYFRVPGVKNVTYAEMGGNSYGVDPGATPVVPTGEVQTMPYEQSFATDFGTYVTKDVAGSQTWEIAYSSAKMSGYSGQAYDNEDWLISSPVQITGVEHAKAVINYAAKYDAPAENDITIQVSSNYEFNAEPSTATWTELSVTFPNNSSGNTWTFTDLEVSLDEFIGQTVNVAVKYTSTTAGARTIEIATITISDGSGVTPPPTPPTPGTGSGSGTQDDPYNVAAGIALQSEEPIAWVQGYIVGAVKSGNSSVTTNDQINWSAPFDLATNVVIADDPSCNEIAQCIIVNLPSGKPLRTQVNLMDHPENLGKTLAVNGKLRAYFGQAGLRDSNGTENDFVLEGGETPPTPPTNAIFTETFASGQGDFTIQNVVIPEGMTFVWSHAAQYSCMKASAYVNGQNYATESWLVSPAITMPEVASATLSLEQAVNHMAPEGQLFVMISTDYAGDVTTATWTELSLSAWPAGTSFEFLTSTVDLTPYVNQTVTLGFKYTSTDTASPTWEVKNVVIE